MLSSYYVLHQLFHMAEVHPQKIALILDFQSWTYSELIEQVEHVVDYLHNLNIVKGQIIYQFVERSLEMVCGFLGIMCIDGVYCPLNPTDSSSRLLSILEQIQSQYVLVHQLTYKQFPTDIVKHVIFLEEILFPSLQNEDIDKLPYCIENGPAFIISTSGTTGRPKAILHTHKSFAASNEAYIQWNANMYTIQDQILQLSTCTWILQISEISLPLVVGGSVVLLRPGGHLDMSYLSKILINQQVTTMIIVPAIIRALIDFFEISQQFDTFKFVRNLCITGEAINPQQWIKFLSYLNLSTIRINSQYGMSECNGVLGCRLSDVYNTIIPIGCPFTNVHCLLIDEQNNIIDKTINLNQIGQLLIGGPTLFNCYLNDRQRTNDILVTIDNKIYLKTGDLARYNEWNEFVHSGRADFQIKIHGQRVETTEIEDTIMNWSRNQISDCLVTKSLQNKDLLVAYIVSHNSDLNIEEIRNHCHKHLRQYMIPSYIIILDKFPLNSNGKIDRKQLPIPSLLINNIQIVDKPISELEEKLHKLWCNVLQLNSISRHANCFALGGSSLSLIQFFNYYQFHFAPDMQLNVLDFFLTPTIADHVQLLLNCKPKSKLIWTPLHLTQGVASFAQNRLWMDEQVRFHEEVSVFNELLIYKFKSISSLSIDRLHQNLRLLVNKHSILRTAILFDQEKLIQKILPLSSEHYHIEMTRVTNEIEIEKIFYDEETNRLLFNLEQGKVFRCHLLLQSSENVLKHNDLIIFNFHHIAIDGNSIQIFINDLRQVLRTDKLSYDEQECLTYLDYSQYERLDDWSNVRQYWENILTSIHPSINQQQNYPIRTGKGYTITFDLDQTIVKSLNQIISQLNLTLFQVGLAAFFVFLFKFSNNDQLEFCTGIVAANRSQYELENLLGFFVNTIPFFIKINPFETFLEFSHRIQQTWLEIFPYSNFPYQEMVKLNSNLRSSFLQTLFLIETKIDDNEQNIEINQENSLNFIDRRFFTGNIAKFDMVCSLFEHRRNETISVTINASLDLYNQSTISTISQRFHSLLKQIFLFPDNELNQYSLFLSDEKLLMKTMNNTQRSFSSFTPFHHKLIDQIRKYSQKISVELDDQSFTYAELLHYTQIVSLNLLNIYHIIPGDIICQCVERSLSMIIGIVAIEMIGCIYCPLSPNDPQYRLNTLIQQMKSRVILTHWLTMSKFVDNDFLLIDIDSILCCDDLNIDCLSNIRITNENIAYIIFTSGSTGIPKSIQIRHENVIECIQSLCSIDLINNQDTILQMAQCSYDVHLQEILGTLMIGASLIMLHPQGNLNIDYLLRILNEKQISYLQSVPSYLNNLNEFVLKSKISTLRTLDIGGDVSRIDLVKNLSNSLFKNARVWNTYGPSETTIDCTFYLVNILKDKETIPIGLPIPNYRCLILDEFLQSCIVNQSGELVVTGVGVFDGYFQRDDLTKDVLIAIDDEIFYKTGDIVHLDQNGFLHYQYRKDYQIKFHGQRIELDEIQQCLLKTSISSCVVMKSNNDHLIAYIESCDITEQDLYEHCRSYLPIHMIPSMFIILKQFPRNENGKIDRKSLSHRNFSIANNFELKRPNNQIEILVHQLWCDIFHRDEISIDSNLFTIGGHSLLVMKLFYRYQITFKLKINSLSITNLFTYSTILDHSRLISQVISTKNNLEESWFPLHLTQGRVTFAQERIFLDEQIRFPSKQNNFMYVIPLVYQILSINNPLSIDRLHRALHTVITKHQILRTGFYLDINGMIIQHCFNSNNEELYGFSVINVNNDVEIDEIIRKIVNRCDLFDLSKGRVLYCHIIRRHHENILKMNDLIIFTIHHLVFDGTSVSIFLNDLSFAYTTDSSLSIDKNLLQCIDSAIHERLIDMKESHEFWYSQLKDYNFIRSLSLPVDRHCLSTDYRSGYHFVTQIYFNDEICIEFLKFVTLYHVTPFQLAMSVFYLYLFKLTDGENDLCFSCLHSNRYRNELQNLIGMFVATLPFRLQLNCQWSLKNLVKQVQENCLAIFQHTSYPLQNILADFRVNYSNVSFLDILFELLTVSSDIHKFSLDGTNLQQVSVERLHEATLFDLNTMFVYDPTSENGKLLCNVYGSRDVFDENTIEKMARKLQVIFSQIFSTKSTVDQIDKLSLILPDEFEEIQNVASNNFSYNDLQLEERLRDIFSQVLGCESADVNQSFSEMGGTSLTVLRMLSLIQKDICPMINAIHLFANPSIRQLARAIKSTLFTTLKVAIIGCGIGGLSAAIALRRHGHEVTVYERTHFASEVGASISVAANGTKFLEEWGVDTIAGRSVILQKLIMHNWKDGTINDVYDLSDYKEKWGYVYNMFHRIDLHEQLQIRAKALGVMIVVDHKAIDIDCRNRTVRFDTGKTISVDLIIGADGVRSTVRSLIGIVAKTIPSTSACYRCIVSTSRVKEFGLKDFAPNNAIEFWGGFGINKIVLAPCCAGEIVSFYCFYPASHNDQSEEGWNFSATPSMLIERFPDLDPDLLTIFQHCEDIKLWKLVIHQPYPYWVRDCVALLGDAAHPMLPDQSQGACMAIEDAAALGIIFSPKYWRNRIHTVEYGLKMYEMLRKTRATRVQEASTRARENLNERIGWSSQRNQQNTTNKLTIDEINVYDMDKHLNDLISFQ